MKALRVRTPVLVFFAGVFVLLAAFVAGISAIHYEFYLLDTVEVAPAGIAVYDYGEFSAHGQRLVDAAIRGERFVFTSPGEVPGPGRPAFGDRIAVRTTDALYVFARRPFFDAFSTNGVVALALAAVGLGTVGYAVRRDMTPRH